MRIARQSRGDDPRWLWQVMGIARTAGTLFVRAYERGERVYIAMLARGYGLGPDRPATAGADAAPARRAWVAALTAPVAAGLIWAGLPLSAAIAASLLGTTSAFLLLRRAYGAPNLERDPFR